MVFNQNPYGNYKSLNKEKAAAKADETPTGTIPEIKEWVGDDKERASRALETENANDKPRKGLVEFLEEVIGE